jgi:hypothetical protein
MLERLIEYREGQQFRKDRKKKQDQKRALMILVPCMAILLVAAGISAVVGGEEPVPVVKAVATPSPASEPVEIAPSVDEEEIDDIEHFAYIVTKPLDELTSEDLDFVESKAEDSCYARYAGLPNDQMITKITACKEAG